MEKKEHLYRDDIITPLNSLSSSSQDRPKSTTGNWNPSLEESHKYNFLDLFLYAQKHWTRTTEQSNHSTQLITQLTATHSYTKTTQCQETDLVPRSTSNSMLHSPPWDCTQYERTARSLVPHALSCSLGTFLPAAFRAVNPAVQKLQPQWLPLQPLYHYLRILNSAALSHIPPKQKRWNPEPHHRQSPYFLLPRVSQTLSSTRSQTVGYEPNHSYQHLILDFYPHTFLKLNSCTSCFK